MKKYLVIIGIIISLNSYSQTAFQELELLNIKNQHDSALIVANLLLETDSSNWQVYYYLGKSYQAKYRFFDAVNALEKANNLDSANARIENVLARVYDAIGKNEEAVNIYYDQFLRDSFRIEPIVNLANIFRKMREYGSSAHYYRKATFIDPQNFYYYKHLGFCISKTNLPTKPAMFAYELAIKLNPYDVILFQQLSNLYNSERLFTEAIITCNKGLKNYPTDKQLMKLKAYALYLNREFDSSIVVFNKLLEYGDSTFFNFKYRGLVHFEKRDFGKAVLDLKMALEHNDQDPETCFFLGSALGRSDEHEEGINYLFQTISIISPPRDELANIYSEIANIYLNQGNYKKSLDHLRMAYKKYASPLISFKMGQLYDYHLNNKRMAINCYEAYITLANVPDSLDLEEGIGNKDFLADPEILKNSGDRIRILKEELFFESAKKE